MRMEVTSKGETMVDGESVHFAINTITWDESFTLYFDDINDDDRYVAHVESNVPKFDVIYSGNDLVLKLFKEAGYLTERFEYINREEWNGTSIRKIMLENGDWHSMLQPEVSAFIDSRNK